MYVRSSGFYPDTSFSCARVVRLAFPFLSISIFTKIPLKTRKNSNKTAKFAKKLQKYAFFLKNICTIQKLVVILQRFYKLSIGI